MELTNSIQNYSNIFPASSQRNSKKHFIKITHYFDNGEYHSTQVVFRWSRQTIKRYDNINIFNSTEYSWLLKSFNNRDTLVKGIEVEYCPLVEKEFNAKKQQAEYVQIADEIFVSLPEVHYTKDYDDTEFFRMRSISYNILDIGVVHWTQVQNRAALYINSIDKTDRFDGNSILMHININKVHEKLAALITLINNSAGKEKSKHLAKFVDYVFCYTMMLYYINVSNGWKFEDITYSKLWNLAMYLLSFAKPFENCDWLKGVTLNKFRYMFNKRASNELAQKGVKHFYRRIAQSKLIEKHTRYMFPKSMDKLKREMFKFEHPKPKTEKQIEKQMNLEKRNQLVKELHDKGFSVNLISQKIGCSIKQVYNILNYTV